MDLSENLRAKVYSVFCKLGNGTRQRRVVQFSMIQRTGENSGVCFDPSCVPQGFHDLYGLSTKDHLTLSIVKRYLDFKVMVEEGGISR